MARERRREGRQEKPLQSRDLPWWFELYHLSWIIVPILLYSWLDIFSVIIAFVLAIIVSMIFG
jgi:hypothetical protein